MDFDLTVKIGGEAGQGIQTVGQMVAFVCHNAGLYIIANNEFESRIRGGHNYFQIRISSQPVHAPSNRIHLLVALDAETYRRHRKEIVADGLILAEEKGSDSGMEAFRIPFEDLAVKAGGKLFSNTVAAGACLALMGVPFDLYQRNLENRFNAKGESVVQKNIEAARIGYDAVSGLSFSHAFEWEPREKSGIILEGTEALALGALAGDCRFAAFYPMSPATGVLTHLTRFSDQFPLVVEQAEDEIAAVNMAIGAAFAGARAMTATSGGGFCLMAEGLGLAAITETPLVIINAQRPGPATGLPTRTAQGDLLFVTFASQDEFPRFVFAPGTVAEAFEMTARAFHLSEKYQVPVIVLVDKYFNDTLFTETVPLIIPEKIERFIVGDEAIENAAQYQRFALTDSGISPRALPCAGEALVLVTGNEHSEDGHISEARQDRVNMVDKRHAKLSAMVDEIRPPKSFNGDAETLLTGWGGSRWAIIEAAEILQKSGYDVGSLIFSDLWPFPAADIEAMVSTDQRLIMVEQNRTAQLGQLIRAQTGRTYHHSVLRYDGRPFYPEEIAETVIKLLR